MILEPNDADIADVLEGLCSAYFLAAASKGFHDLDTYEALNQSHLPSKTYDELQDTKRLFLIVGEAVEAFEELRAGHAPTETYYSTSHDYELALGDNSWFTASKGTKLTADEVDAWSDRDSIGTEGLFKPEGVPSELADLLIRVFDYAGMRDIDLAGIMSEKAKYNKTREQMHGKRF